MQCVRERFEESQSLRYSETTSGKAGPNLSTSIPIDSSILHEWTCALLGAGGASEKSAQTTSRHLIESSRRGVHSHGLMRLPQYIDEMSKGLVEGHATPSLTLRAPTTAVIDGANCLGQVACEVAIDFVVAVAPTEGVAVALVRRMGHSGRLGQYVEDVADQGLIGVACGTGALDGHRVAPF
ncbi:MAG: Ldh family oxidoreductase, partial [bacterium]